MWKDLETTLSKDVTEMKSYFDKWHLKMNTNKTVSSVFHLNNRESHGQLNITIDNISLPSDQNPKYLGVSLDRQLTYKNILKQPPEKLAKGTA